MASRTAVIIGAGPAGLTAAYELIQRTDIRPIVLEASDMVGGIARTEDYKGNRIDIGGHRFFSKSQRVMKWWLNMLPLQGVGPTEAMLRYQGQQEPIVVDGKGPDPDETDEVMLIRNRKSRIYYQRKLFDYPLSLSLQTLHNLGLVHAMRAGASYVKAKCLPVLPENTLEDFLINRFGRHLYEAFFASYTEKVWGVPCSEISAEWGAQRIKGLSITRLLKHALTTRKGPGDVLQRGTETSLIERFLYPKYGPGQMWELCAKRVREAGGEVQFGHRVASVQWEKSKVCGVVTMDHRGERHEWIGDFYFSTMPIRDLIGGMEPATPRDVAEVASGLIYRDFLTVGLLLKKMKRFSETQGQGKCVDDNWMYIQEPDVRVGRLQIFNNWSPYLVENPKTVWLGLEYFCNEGDDLWQMEDLDLGHFGAEELAKIGLIDSEDVLDSTVIRTPKAYPAYFGSYKRFPVLRDFLDQLENFYPVGRNGMHRYNNQDHSMLTAMIAVDNIVEGRVCKANIWNVNTEQEYHEEKDGREEVQKGCSEAVVSTQTIRYEKSKVVL